MVAQGMQQRQSLALQQVLSPQLQQSLLILQTPLLELRNLVQQEMETNPVLEELPEDSGANEQSEAEASADENFKDEFEKLATLDEDGVITWRSRPAPASMADMVRRKQMKSASSCSIPFQSRKRSSKIS
jgi:RNA polymerase sigma-54 factor